jgi:hypothetical protein
MPKQVKKLLPIIAVAAAAVTLVTMIVLSLQKQSALEDSDETRSFAEAAVRRLQEVHPVTLDDTGFLNALTEAAQMPYIGRIRVFNPDGSPAHDQRRSVGTRSGLSIQPILVALPPGLFTEEQEGWLVAASTMLPGEEHADVFNCLLRPLHGPDGSLTGIVGIAFDRSPWVSAPGAGWIIGVLLALVGLGTYWLSLPWWVFLDAGERGERAWVWAIFVFIGNFIALIAYLLTRAPHPDSIT